MSEDVKGVKVNWNVLTMIVTVALITGGGLSWFNAQLAALEKKMDAKYATREIVEAQRVQIYMTTINGLQNNLEKMLEIMIKQEADPAVIESIRIRIKELRAQRLRYMSQFVDRHD